MSADIDQADGWVVVKLPAIAEENDPMGRPVGAALWPERFPIEELEKIRKRIFEYPFASLYQQNPIPKSGGLFKRDNFKIIQELPPNIERWFMFFDLALSEKTSADFTVGTLVGVTDQEEYVVAHEERTQKDWDDIPEFLEKAMLKQGNKVSYGIEQVFFHGQAVKKVLKRPKLLKFSIKGIPTDKDKYTRAAPVADRVAAGMVYVLDRVWTQDWLTEVCAFPFAANDDRVDSFVGAVYMRDAIKDLQATFKAMKGKEENDGTKRPIQARFR